MSFAPISDSRPTDDSSWESMNTYKYALSTEHLLKPEIPGVVNVQSHLPWSRLPHAISMPVQNSSRLLQCKGSSEGCSQGLSSFPSLTLVLYFLHYVLNGKELSLVVLLLASLS